MIINVIENRYRYESEFWCKDTKKIALCQEFEGSFEGSLAKQAFSNRKEALRKVYATLLPIPFKPHSIPEGCIIRLQTSLTPPGGCISLQFSGTDYTDFS